MKNMPRLAGLTEYSGAMDLAEPWRRSTMRAMGFDDWEAVESKSGTTTAAHRGAVHHSDDSDMQIINLLDLPTEEKRTEAAASDPWMSTAVQIQSNIREMAEFLAKKKLEYVSVTMPDEEASLIESTVTNFTATTANETEALRQCVLAEEDNSSQRTQHRIGVVQILMSQLKEGIAEPFGRLQRQRNRAAVQIWQNPLQCRLTVRRRQKARQDRELDAALGLDESDREADQRFVPQRPSHRFHQNFLESYAVDRDAAPRKRPASLFRKASKRSKPSDDDGDDDEEPSAFAATATTTGEEGSRILPQRPPHQLVPDKLPDYHGDFAATTSAAELQQEAAQLQLVMHSDLDSVQKMEQTMVNITTLLSQFADLVAEQHEDVALIHDTTEDAKENMDKGQEHLVEAEQRTSSSRHYMATAIAAMGWLLLLFHWLRP